MAFIRGVCGAVLTAVTPIAVNIASKAAVNLASRSRIRWVNRCPASSRTAVKSRISCVAQARWGIR
jgi:hypothetical protein